MTSTPLAWRSELGAGGFANPVRLLLSARPWVATAFLLLSFALGIFWFVTLVTLLATAAGLTVTLVGLPLLAGTMFLWIGGAQLERRRVQAFLGVAIPSPYRRLPAGSWFVRLRGRALDPAVWRDLLYLVLLFPLGIAEFVIAVVVVTVPLSMITLPAYFWTMHRGSGGAPYAVDSLPEALLVALVGVPLLLLMPYVLVGVAHGHALLARALLGPTNAELQARVGELTASRSGAVDAALAERRRIERDLHDGAQQRLVALAMNLGMAKHKLKSDPEAAHRLMNDAHEEARHALVELRNLVRGIHPAVLSDRGLDAALSALAGRCSVPVAVDVELDGRLPDVVESAAYFVVAEALTNVVKHSVATEAYVGVRREGRLLVVEVTDNGIGGADAEAGTGLTGLAGRVAALDGRLTVESPRGGGTRLRAELPCVL